MSATFPGDVRSGCDMAPLVEARRDGRVGERESASLDRHLAGCATCRDLTAALARLSDFAGRPSVPSLSPLEQRRERLRLLRDAAFAPASLAAPRSRVQLVRFAAASAMIVAVLAGGTALAVLGLPSAKADPETPPSIAVASSAAPINPRPVILATVAEPIVEPPPSSATPPVAPVAPAIVAPRPAPPHVRATVAAPSAAQIGPGMPDGERSGLADGVELIERGDYGAAADRLRAFRQSHPTDLRAQDAAFLGVLALERAGRHAAAVTAAQEYLASYPKGYRRAEAQAILATP